MAFLMPFMCVYFFAKGYNMSHEDQKKPFKITKKPKMTAEEKMMNSMLEKIDSYDGLNKEI